MYQHGQRLLARLPIAIRRRQSGLSLLELLITLAIVAGLAATGSAHLSQAMQLARAHRLQQELVADLRFAQSEALRRGREVTIERLDCDRIQYTQLKDWSCGWLVFINQDELGRYSVAEDTLIKKSSLDVPVLVRSFKNYVRFSQIGSTTDLQAFLIGPPGVYVIVSWFRIRT